MLELHEPKRLQHTLVNLVGNSSGFLDQPIGNVLFHGQGVEERALLKDHSDLPAQREQVFFAHCRNFIVEDGDAAGVWLQQT